MLSALSGLWMRFWMWVWVTNPLARWWGWYKWDVHPDMDAVWEPWRSQVRWFYRQLRAKDWDVRIYPGESLVDIERELHAKYPETTLVDRWRYKRLGFWIVYHWWATEGQAVREFRRMRSVVDRFESRIREMGS